MDRSPGWILWCHHSRPYPTSLISWVLQAHRWVPLLHWGGHATGVIRLVSLRATGFIASCWLSYPFHGVQVAKAWLWYYKFDYKCVCVGVCVFFCRCGFKIYQSWSMYLWCSPLCYVQHLSVYPSLQSQHSGGKEGDQEHNHLVFTAHKKDTWYNVVVFLFLETLLAVHMTDMTVLTAHAHCMPNFIWYTFIFTAYNRLCMRYINTSIDHALPPLTLIMSAYDYIRKKSFQSIL